MSRLLLVCCSLLLLAACQSEEPAAPPAAAPATAPAAAGPAPHVIIVTSQGEIEVELSPDKAPRTVANFLQLVESGFYSGTIFHRVVDDFVIQGGGFTAQAQSKPSPLGNIPLEIHPELTHVDGALAMARTSDPNSAAAQFYICDGAQPMLNDAVQQRQGGRGYAVFGKTVRGMEVVRKIAALRPVNRGGVFAQLTDPVVVIESARVVR